MMSLLHIFAANVRRYRVEAGMSQKEFADLTGLHRTYISALERERRSIALDNVEKIASALNVEAHLLFVDNEGSNSRR